MNSRFKILVLFSLVIVMSCESENEKDKYGGEAAGEDGAIASFSFNGNFDDEIGDFEIATSGKPVFTEGIVANDSAILLDGEDDFLTTFIGYHDTLGISLWFKSNVNYAKEGRDLKPALVDYGAKSLYTSIDAVSYATVVNTNVEGEVVGNNSLLSTSYWTHLYIEANKNNPGVVFYIDGYLEGKDTTLADFSPEIDIVYFGRASNADDLSITYYNGCLDEIKFFARGLSKEEIKQLADKENYK